MDKRVGFVCFGEVNTPIERLQMKHDEALGVLKDMGYDLLTKAGRKRGFLMRGAEVDTERMARILLDEFRGGKLGRFTLETVEEPI